MLFSYAFEDWIVKQVWSVLLFDRIWATTRSEWRVADKDNVMSIAILEKLILLQEGM